MKKILITILLFISSIYANELYTIKDIQLKDDSGNKLATITKGTKVNVLKNKGNNAFIKVLGWSYEDEPNSEIFQKDGVTVVLADLSKEGISKRKVLQSKEDAYEEVWIENSIQGWISKKDLTKNFIGLWKKEMSLASERCSGCHEAPAPDSHFAGEFPSLLDSMAEQAGLSSDEKSILINYFQKRNIYKQ